jgi:exopolysaccharide biosynthesis polyprenyl glycosylphosphotransferase
LLLVAGDALCVALVVRLTELVLPALPDGPARIAARILAICLWLALLAINEAYDLHVSSSRRRITNSLGTTALLVACLAPPLLLATDAALLGGAFGGLRTLLLAAIGPVAAAVPLFCWRRLYVRLCTSPSLRQRAIVIGNGEHARALVRRIREATDEYEFLGFIAPTGDQGLGIGDQGLGNSAVSSLRSAPAIQPPAPSPQPPILGCGDDLLALTLNHRAREVVLATDAPLSHTLLAALTACHERGVAVKPLAVLYEEVLGWVPVDAPNQQVFPIPLWRTQGSPTFYGLVKGASDRIAALVGLLIAAPLLPLIALAIALDTPGPVFYTQERLGRAGRPFRLIKFRSMTTDAESGGQPVWATPHDARVTRVGRLLRRTRFDELPQLWNVLLGHMSLVGPRPERPAFVAQLQAQIPFYRTRLSVKPGLTGWAQIKLGYTSTPEGALMKLQYDLYYIKHQSLALDLLILLRTIRVVLAMGGQ